MVALGIAVTYGLYQWIIGKRPAVVQGTQCAMDLFEPLLLLENLCLACLFAA